MGQGGFQHLLGGHAVKFYAIHKFVHHDAGDAGVFNPQSPHGRAENLKFGIGVFANLAAEDLDRLSGIIERIGLVDAVFGSGVDPHQGVANLLINFHKFAAACQIKIPGRAAGKDGCLGIAFDLLSTTTPEDARTRSAGASDLDDIKRSVCIGQVAIFLGCLAVPAVLIKGRDHGIEGIQHQHVLKITVEAVVAAHFSWNAEFKIHFQ